MSDAISENEAWAEEYDNRPTNVFAAAGARYQIVSTTRQSDVVLIRDVGHHVGKTITNAVEEVIWTMIARKQLLPNDRLFYIDSDGDLAEICHEQSVFLGFATVAEAGEAGQVAVRLARDFSRREYR